MATPEAEATASAQPPSQQPNPQPSEAPQQPQSQRPQEESQQQEQQQAQTPKPTPGPRATRLVQLYNQALDHTLSKLAYQNLEQCYPTLARKSPDMLHRVQGQIVDRLGEKCRREFDGIVEGRKVVERLNELEGLIGEAGARRKEGGEPGVAPHTLPPDEILAAHLHPSLRHHQSQLNARLQTTQSQNALLHEEILRQRKEIEDLVGRLEGVLGDVKGANHVLGEVVEGLGREAVEGRRVVDEA